LALPVGVAASSPDYARTRSYMPHVGFRGSPDPCPFCAPATGVFVPVDKLPCRNTFALYTWDWPAERAGSSNKKKSAP